MKKNLFLILLVLAFIGCSSDDDQEKESRFFDFSLLVGKWEIQKSGLANLTFEGMYLIIDENKTGKIFIPYLNAEESFHNIKIFETEYNDAFSIEFEMSDGSPGGFHYFTNKDYILLGGRYFFREE